MMGKLFPDRIPVAVLGAMGAVGQRFVQLLDGHPWFTVVALTGSDRAVGQRYGSACHWILPNPMPEWAKELPILPTDPEIVVQPLVFSALPSVTAREKEPLFASHGTVVCSNASAFRQEPDVPLILPEVNPDHTALIHQQRRLRSWPGFIVTNPNCTITGLTIVLKALHDAFGVSRAFIVSMQAVSGAGYPGTPSIDVIGNVVPFIQDEEEKMEWEPRKMLGNLRDAEVELAQIEISAHANRVSVPEGHMVCLSVELSRKGSTQEVSEAFMEYQSPHISRDLPFAPNPVIILKSEQDRPQPRLDLMTGDGMTTVVGRLRPDPILHHKMVILSHNTIRGAAGGSIFNAELLVNQGHLIYKL
jgi:aspartate-semialdehyde dehydrogenase